jgi:hypothetical protein
MYREFIEHKSRLSPFPRPIPFIPEHLSSTTETTKLPTDLIVEGRDLSKLMFRRIDLSNRSIRHSDLTDTSFIDCKFIAAKLEGARLVGTRIEKLSPDAMRGAQFGNIEHFEYIYAESRYVDDRETMKAWMSDKTGIVEKREDPYSAALQVRTLFKKFIHEDGSGRRDQLPLHALSHGRVYKGAPTPIDCVAACTKGGFFTGPNYRNYVRRGTGGICRVVSR